MTSGRWELTQRPRCWITTLQKKNLHCSLPHGLKKLTRSREQNGACLEPLFLELLLLARIKVHRT